MTLLSNSPILVPSNSFNQNILEIKLCLKCLYYYHFTKSGLFPSFITTCFYVSGHPFIKCHKTLIKIGCLDSKKQTFVASTLNSNVNQIKDQLYSKSLVMFKKSDTLTKKLPPCCTIQAGKGSQGLHSSDVVTLCMIRSDCLRLLCTDFDHRSHKLSQELSDHDRTKLCILADSRFFKNLQHQGGVKSTVSWVFEDLKFKISEGYKQN